MGIDKKSKKNWVSPKLFGVEVDKTRAGNSTGGPESLHTGSVTYGS